MNIFFLCTDNSCRSILAEAIFNHLALDGWYAVSAGSDSIKQVHPRSLAILSKEGISTECCFSKAWDKLPVKPDIVITLCDNNANETCPAYLGTAVSSHWSVEDPAQVTGADTEIEAAFTACYRILRYRIETLLSLPLQELQQDLARLEMELDRIGELLPTT